VGFDHVLYHRIPSALSIWLGKIQLGDTPSKTTKGPITTKKTKAEVDISAEKEFFLYSEWKHGVNYYKSKSNTKFN